MTSTLGYRIVPSQQRELIKGSFFLEWDPNNVGWLLHEVIEKKSKTITFNTVKDFRAIPLRENKVQITAEVDEKWYILKALVYDISKSLDKKYEGHLQDISFDLWKDIIYTQFRLNPLPPIS